MAMQTMRPTDSFQSIHKQHFFFQAAPLRTLLEAIILGITGGLVLLLWERFLSPANWQISLNVLFGAVCVLVFVLRLRLPKAFLQRQSFYDGMIAIVLCLALSGMQLVFTLFLFPDWGANPPLQGISR